MNGDEFLDKLELVDSRYVEQAAQPSGTNIFRSIAVRRCAAVACLAVLLGAGLLALYQNYAVISIGDSGQSVPEGSIVYPPYPDNIILPEKDTPAPAPLELSLIHNNGMGFEGYMAHNIRDLVNGNPWTPDMKLSTLPVYENAVLYDSNQQPLSLDCTAMREFLLAIAARLGLDPESLIITDNAPSEEEQQAIRQKHALAGIDPPSESIFAPTVLIAQSNGITIQVDQSMTARIDFEEPVAYPDDLTFPVATASYKDTEKLSSYLLETYFPLLGMENPIVDISGGDYDIHGNQYFDIAFYEDVANNTEKILQYNFNRFRFCNNDDGKLFLIWISRPDLSHLHGNYPILPEAQAREELLSGHYVTSVPCDTFAAEDIKKVELVYYFETYQPLYIPYYKYYIDITEHLPLAGNNPNEFRQYGAYYVPAIHPDYLEQESLWDGHLNEINTMVKNSRLLRCKSE